MAKGKLCSAGFAARVLVAVDHLPHIEASLQSAYDSIPVEVAA